MNEFEINRKIATWLGLEIFEEGKYIYKVERYETHVRFAKTKKLIKLDFLHDRNQQKWIIDELKKRGYTISTVIDNKGTNITIYREKECPDGIMYDYNETTSRKEEGEAFIEAVMELI